MTPDRGATDRRAATTIARLTARRAARSGAVWGVLFGALIANEALGYQGNFPTLDTRQEFARTFTGKAALAAVTGSTRQLDTIEGFVAWRVFGLLILVGAVWGVLTATRLLRGEEDGGRWELLLAGRTTRRHATVQGLAGLAAGFVVLWALTAGFTFAAGRSARVGFSASAALFYATACVASAAIFLVIGALASQLGRTRRQANALAGAVFAVAFLVRMVADSVTGLAWMRWASPLGWVENLHPLTGSSLLPLVPIVALVVAAATLTIILAGRRDVGAGVLARRGEANASMRWLGGPAVMVVRLERWVAVAWIAGLGALALIFGVVAASAAEADLGDQSVEQAVARLGGQQGGAAAWIGYEFIYLAALVAFAATGQVSAMRAEEADGHLDNLLARAASRRRWLAGRVGFGAAVIVVAGLATAIGGWIGVRSGASNVGFAAMLQAGLNLVPPALFVLGVGTLLFGLAPRVAVPMLYGLVLWSFVVQIIGSSITTNQWLLDTAVFSHLGPVPAADLEWPAIAGLSGLAAVTCLAGLVAFERRDLEGA